MFFNRPLEQSGKFPKVEPRQRWNNKIKFIVELYCFIMVTAVIKFMTTAAVTIVIT